VKSNVFILLREKGRLVDYREGHNIWVDQGREYLAQSITDVSSEERGVKHIAFGIGGTKQGLPGIADAPPMLVSYPFGFDPVGTNGHEYRTEYPINPLIQTLERPVRITGGVAPYSPPPAGDTWFTAPPPPGFIRTFTASERAATTEGSVDLVGSFPGTLDGKTIRLRTVDDGSQLHLLPADQTVTFSSPANAAAVISQIEAQTTGINAELGPSNGLVLFTDTAGTTAKLQIVGGTALTDLGIAAEKVSGSTPGEVIFRTIIDATAGDIAYGTFTQVPLSEVGLFLGGLVDPGTDFYSLGHLVAYHTFDTILLTPSHELELFWLVRF